MRYDRDEACRAWLTRGYLRYGQLRALTERFDSAEEIYDTLMRSSSEFEELLQPAQVLQLKRLGGRESMHTMLVTMQKHDMHVMSMDDPIYPQRLLDISDPPVFLYWRGDPECLRQRCVTIVGTRSATLDALDATREIARSLSDSGVTVISGMANGIDQAAHRGCLEGKSPTVGVLGTGLDVDYPAGAADLKRELLDRGGLLLSEYPPGATANKWTFPVRNRILSGLSAATVMMECSIKSGSMSTVNHALNQGREVFAWPNRAGSPAAEGAHQLIREGARYFTTAQDILEDMNWQDVKPLTPEQHAALPPMTPEQMTVYRRLLKGEQSLDELAMATGMDSAALSGTLTMLQLMGVVRSLPGKLYRLV